MANSSLKFEKRYGAPPFRENFDTDKLYIAALLKFESRFMILWDIPADINAAFPCLPNKLYCNKDIVKPLEAALRELISAFHAGILKPLDSLVTFDGCYNIRRKRGLSSLSLHTWAAAIDINAFRNQLGQPPTFSEAFARIWEKHGFIWGGRWGRKDGMHFELNIDLLK